MKAGEYYIAIGMSPRYKSLGHAVIYKGKTPYWDPHPKGGFLRDGKVLDFYSIHKSS